jgi:hypothetical protein
VKCLTGEDPIGDGVGRGGVVQGVRYRPAHESDAAAVADALQQYPQALAIERKPPINGMKATPLFIFSDICGVPEAVTKPVFMSEKETLYLLS